MNPLQSCSFPQTGLWSSSNDKCVEPSLAHRIHIAVIYIFNIDSDTYIYRYTEIITYLCVCIFLDSHIPQNSTMHESANIQNHPTMSHGWCPELWKTGCLGYIGNYIYPVIWDRNNPLSYQTTRIQWKVHPPKTNMEPKNDGFSIGISSF